MKMERNRKDFVACLPGYTNNLYFFLKRGVAYDKFGLGW